MKIGRRDALGLAGAGLFAVLPGAAAAAAEACEAWAPDWLRGALGLSSAEPRTLHISPEGAGARDGAAWESAGALAQLDDFIRAAGPGGTVLLAPGRYRLAHVIEITHGGAPGRPVTVRSAGARAELVGARSAHMGEDRDKGAECFRLLRGADHLVFQTLHFADIGNGCFRVGRPVRDLTAEDCTFHNVYRFIENTASGDARDASINGFVVRRCTGSRIERSFARIRYGSAGGLIEDCRADSEGVEGDPFAVGCALEDGAHDITYRRCVMENFRQSNGENYWNGDGFSDEEDNYNIRYEHCEARGSTDGGFDCKSRDLVLEHCLAEDNKRNFRFWSARALVTSCTSRNPNWRGRPVENGGPTHVWLGGEGEARIVMLDFAAEAADATPVFSFEADDIIVDVRGRRFALPPDAPIVSKEGAHGCEVRFTD